MTPVTDPKILSQLNQVSSMRPVTDPNILSQLNGESNNESLGSQALSLGGRVAGDVLGGFAQAGQGLHNSPYNLANMVGGNKLASLFPKPTNYDFGQGNLIGTPSPNIADRFVQGVSQYAPYSSLGLAGSIPGAVAEGSIFGATQGSNPLQDAAISGGLNAIPGLLGKATSGIASIASPEKYTASMVNKLKDMAQKGSDMYKPVIDKYGDEPLSSNGYEPEFNKLSSDSKESLSKNYKLRDMISDFDKNPTIENAHNLKKQLGYNQRKLEKSDSIGMLSAYDQNILNATKEAKNILNSDLENSLQNIDPNAGNLYKNANLNYARNVAPYLRITKNEGELTSSDLNNYLNDFIKKGVGKNASLTPKQIKNGLIKRETTRNALGLLGGGALGIATGHAFDLPEVMSGAVGAIAGGGANKLASGYGLSPLSDSTGNSIRNMLINPGIKSYMANRLRDNK